LVADLNEKTIRYKLLFEKALNNTKFTNNDELNFNPNLANEFYTMAKAYYDDAIHFIKINDLVNALACLNYGHAWLDAGIRAGIFYTIAEK
jgi:hypothetical protein